ncbi:origin recognition complex subunit 1-like [Leptopilina boulardi]|uniref:origin recognition complex subunit 1-like n=1 Tax=Leptopilina boulardi TaxID=63433 RepID=UPI0021F54C3A|nr:origin recognition complex subunit 1-like [Leptopilina boulardi]
MDCQSKWNLSRKEDCYKFEESVQKSLFNSDNYEDKNIVPAHRTFNIENSQTSSGRNLRVRNKKINYRDGKEKSSSPNTRSENKEMLNKTQEPKITRSKREPSNSNNKNVTYNPRNKKFSKSQQKSNTREKKNIAQLDNKLSNKGTLHKRRILIRNLTPPMQTRNSIISKPKTNIEKFRTRLHVSFMPKSLPCREAEFNNIFTFIKGKLTEEMGGCIYISGVPGTGKTATVNEVILCLKKLVSKGELSPFEFVDINGMKLTEPRQAYVQIKKQLTKTASSWGESLRYLHHRFTKSVVCKNMTLLLIDEMDLLCTKRQDVIYNLLDWPTHKTSQLIVITIANAMDLPERVLMKRITSRLGLTRLIFNSYNHIQLMEIIKTRLNDMKDFNLEAIELVARKVASFYGDARRALDICRRATEIAECDNNRDFVKMLDVTFALNEMITNSRVQAIKCCSMMEIILLEAISQEITRTGIEQVTFQNVYTQFETICILEGEEVPKITPTLEICRKLSSWGLILWESGTDLYQNILLNVTADDINFSRRVQNTGF